MWLALSGAIYSLIALSFSLYWNRIFFLSQWERDSKTKQPNRFHTSFTVLFIFDKIKVKMWVLFQCSTEWKIVKYLQFGTFLFFMIRNHENQQLTSIFMFDFRPKLNERMTHDPLSRVILQTVGSADHTAVTPGLWISSFCKSKVSFEKSNGQVLKIKNSFQKSNGQRQESIPRCISFILRLSLRSWRNHDSTLWRGDEAVGCVVRIQWLLLLRVPS